MIKLKNKLPNDIPIFPLSNFILFPKTTVPLNIFEPRYLSMIDDVMKENRIIGMTQPQNSNKKIPLLYNVGCAGKITSFNETGDGRYLILLSGVSRFKIIEELESPKLYRSCKVNYDDFSLDLKEENENIGFSDLKLILKNLKSLFVKHGYLIDWKELETQSVNQTINTLIMASPFSLEEKQILLETISLKDRKKNLEDILLTYNFDNFDNKTIQ